MRKGVFLSAAVHIAIILVAWLGLPHLLPEPEEFAPSIPVEVVTIDPTAEKEVPKPPKQEKPKPPPPPQPPTPPDLKPEPEPEPDPKPAPQPAPTPAPQPAPAAPPSEPKPDPKPEPEPEPVPTPAPQPEAEQPKPRLEPEIAVRKPPPPKPDFMNLLKDMKAELEETAPPTEKGPEEKAPETEQLSLDDRREVNALVGEIQRQIAPCWNLQGGGKDAEQTVVEIRLYVNPDGSVQNHDIIDAGRMNNDPFFRAVAETARRAVLDARCTPLRLPQESYNLWQQIVLTFDPKRMFGL